MQLLKHQSHTLSLLVNLQKLGEVHFCNLFVDLLTRWLPPPGLEHVPIFPVYRDARRAAILHHLLVRTRDFKKASRVSMLNPVADPITSSLTTHSPAR